MTCGHRRLKRRATTRAFSGWNWRQSFAGQRKLAQLRHKNVVTAKLRFETRSTLCRIDAHHVVDVEADREVARLARDRDRCSDQERRENANRRPIADSETNPAKIQRQSE